MRESRRNGGVIWKHKAKDSFKATPAIVGDRIIASGLDHHIYCLNATDGTIIWDYETGFEIDCSAAVFDGRIYFGGEDGFFYCLSLKDGSLIYKTERLGSMEGSFSAVDGRIYGYEGSRMAGGSGYCKISRCELVGWVLPSDD